jgi:phosphonate transport system substrate-binding protein
MRGLVSGHPAPLLVVALLVFGACTTDPVPNLDLSVRSDIPSPEAGTVVRPLRVAVAAILSPAGNIESYGEFGDYLGDALGRPVELLQRRTYEEINAMLASGEADIGFVCTSAYVVGHDDFGLRLLAAPEIHGETVYRSVLITPAGSGADSMAELRGAVFAFTDPMSLSGRMYPTSVVEALGETPETFFARTFFTYSHEEAIEAVASRVAGGAAVDSLVLDHVLASNPDLPIEIVAASPPFAIPPVVASPLLPAAQVEEIRSLLLGLHQQSEASAALESMGVDRFVVIDDAAYDGVRAVMSRTELGR